MSIADRDRDGQENATCHQSELSVGGDLESVRKRDEALLAELDEVGAGPLPTTGVAPELRATVRAARDQMAAENLAQKPRRDERRKAARRASPEYQAELKEARETYAAKIEAEKGREVRAYAKVPGKTCAERMENAKARDAARQRDRWANATQVQKDKKADKVWATRQRKKGWTGEQIAEGLAKRVADRAHRQPDPVAYEDNPDFGAF